MTVQSPKPARRPLRDLARPGLRAIRANWRPFLLLQAAALAFVIAYFNVDALRGAMADLAAFRERVGVAFTMVAAAVAGAMLPEVAKALTQRGWRIDRAKLIDTGFLVVFFALNGLLVDRFYALLGVVFGEAETLGVIAKKALVDQFLFTPLLATPYVAAGLSIRRHGYSIAGAWREFARSPARWYVARAVTLMLPGWCFWGPMVCLIYSLPGPLQVAMWAGAMGAWSLVMVFIGAEEPDAPVPPPE